MQPYIPASRNLPELTFKTIVLGFILAALLAASNCYLGLKVGRTISASIPAAVISMAVFRFFRNSNILENNLVQTAATAGEGLAGAMIFTVPAIVMMGYWKSFPFWKLSLIILLGGILGVLFSVPLRRYMINEKDLTFPESVAVTEVLKIGDEQGKGTHARDLLLGSAVSALFTFCQAGLKICSEHFVKWFSGAGTVFTFGVGFSPVLIAAGYIIGSKGAISMALGMVISWVVTLPTYGWLFGLQDAGDAAASGAFIKEQIRFMGVGAMAVGGFWGIISLCKPIGQAIKTSCHALLSHQKENFIRTERDIPMTIVIMGVLLILLPLALLIKYAIDQTGFEISSGLYWSVIGFCTLFAVIMGGFGSAVASYLVGFVGSTAFPVSGIALTVILSGSLVLLGLFKLEVDLSSTHHLLSAASLTIVIGAIVCAIATIGGENMQDLKAGHIIGATPWKQQLILIVGVVAGAIVTPFILNLLYNVYGFDGALPHSSMDPSKALAAPQATLMASVARAVFMQNLKWNMVLLGAGVAVIVIIFDRYLKQSGSSVHLPVLSVGAGMYLPMTHILMFCLGGMVQGMVERKAGEKGSERGTLMAAGIIAGESLIGLVLTYIFAAYGGDGIFAVISGGDTTLTYLLGAGGIAGLGYMIYRCGTREEIA